MTLRPAVQCDELAVGGALSPAVVLGADGDCTCLIGRVESQRHRSDVPATIGPLHIDLISLRPISSDYLGTVKHLDRSVNHE